jgi:DNA-binding Lrp family transcriptional regulator
VSPESRAIGAQKRRVDETDERILWELRRDADLTNAELASRVGLSASAAHTRVRALRASGVLGAAHADVDLSALGLPLQAIVAVRMRAQARPAIKTYAAKVARLPNVLNIYFLGGQTDFLIHVVTTSPEQLRDFVATRLSMDPAVASTETQIVFDWVRPSDRAAGFDDMRGPIT